MAEVPAVPQAVEAADRPLSGGIGAQRFSVLCLLSDLLLAVTEAHREFVVSDGDVAATARAMGSVRAVADKIVVRAAPADSETK